MPRYAEDWQSLLFAVERKLKIAEYHLDQLKQELSSPELVGSDVPPIPVQAHLEGVLIALASAENQLVKGVVIALGIKQSDEDVHSKAMRELERLVPNVREWSIQEIVRDIRFMRNRVIHCHYVKDPSAHGHRWRIESANTRYGASRELLAYTSAAVEHGQRLLGLLPSIKQVLSDEEQRR